MTAQVVAVKPGTTAPEVGRVAFDVAFPQRGHVRRLAEIAAGLRGHRLEQLFHRLVESYGIECDQSMRGNVQTRGFPHAKVIVRMAVSDF